MDAGAADEFRLSGDALQDARVDYKELVAKLRAKHMAELTSNQDALRESKMSTASQPVASENLQQQQLIESTGGGYVSSHPPPSQGLSKRRKGDSCPHPSMIGDKCVANCRLCGVFMPKVSP